MILVFGSINVDVTVPVPHLPRPGETVLGGDYALLPGGKGANQALAARRAGGEVALAGAVGRDGFADVALDLLRRDGVGLDLVRVVERPTGCAQIMVGEGGENLIAVASGANGAVAAGQVPDDRFGPGVTLVCLIARELPRHRAIEDRASSQLDADAIRIFDQLYDKIKTAQRPADRAKLLADAQRLLAEDCVHAFLYQPQWVTVANKNVRGLWKDMPVFVNDLSAMSWA